MTEGSADLKTRFTEFLSSLPEEKRQQIVDKLRQTDPSMREAMIRKILEYNDTRMNRQPAVTHSYEHRYEQISRQQDKPVRKLKGSVVKAIYTAVAALLLIAVVVTGFVLGGFSKLASGGGGSETAASSVESENETEAPTPTEVPTATPTPTPTPTPEPTHVPLLDEVPDLSGLTVVIDPGHQAETDPVTENCASWLSAEKPRCTSGCEGVATGVHEYDITLRYGLIAADYLRQCGANVILTREENDVNISNQERAAVAVSNGADLFIRLHADAANDSLTSGVRVYIPDSGDFTQSGPGWGETLGTLVAEAEGLQFNGVRSTHLYTGLNYAGSVRSFQVCLGYLSNSDDEAILQDQEIQIATAAAIAEFCSGFV